MAEAAKLNMVVEYWKHADTGLRDEFERMRSGFAFYVGDQWEPADTAMLDKEKRPHLTINLVLPIINLLSGIQRQSRQDIFVVARKGGYKSLAEVLTQVLRHSLDITDSEYETADAFMDGIIGSKGWVNLDIDHADDPVSGDITLTKVSPFDIREDPDAKEYDLNRSGKFVIRDYWYDKERLLLNWPKKEQDILKGGLDIDPGGGDITGNADLGKLRYRTRECWHKSFEKRLILINGKTNSVKQINPEALELATAIANRSNNWHLKDWVVPVLNKTVTAGNIVLEDIADPYSGFNQFPYYRFCPFWVDGYVMGVVQNLRDAQREVNKRRSQALHNLNQTANSGFKVKKVMNNYDRHLAKHGSTPGVVLDESKAGGKIERIEPAPLSQGHITSASLSADDMKEISGANPDLQGQLSEGFHESGKAIELRQAQGMKVVEVMFDNFARTQKMIAHGLVDMVRFTNVYSDAEIRQIASEENVNVDLGMLKNKRFGRYGIKVKSSSSSPTAQYADFMSMLEIAKMYPDRIPPEVVIENSTLANKEVIAQQVSSTKSVQQAAVSKKETSKPFRPTKDFKFSSTGVL